MMKDQLISCDLQVAFTYHSTDAPKFPGSPEAFWVCLFLEIDSHFHSAAAVQARLQVLTSSHALPNAWDGS